MARYKAREFYMNPREKIKQTVAFLGEGASTRAIMEHLGLKSTSSVHYWLARMEVSGEVDYVHGHYVLKEAE